MKRYVQVGLGSRAGFFYNAIAERYHDTSEITAFCDINHGRMKLAQKQLKEKYNYSGITLYDIQDFDRMLEEQQPDCLIVTSIDRTHHKYIKKALERGIDVISEKPMTTDAAKCQEILDAVAANDAELRVSFNYRYAPHNTKVRELIRDGAIGKINQVHFEWQLNTSHGADYFRRWHRDKRNSGGLLVHKSTHHFDLVNFWLGTEPKTVFAMGDLMFYGRANAEERGETKFYHRVKGSENAIGDPFALDIENPQLKELYLDAEDEDGYFRDLSVFGDGISIEDTMSVLVGYKSGAMMSYSLNAYSPMEGFRVVFTGTAGRIELDVMERVYVSAAGEQADEGAVEGVSLMVYPMFDKPYRVEIEHGEGGHGGGDPVLLRDLFGVAEDDAFNRAASHVDGAMSILTGIAANKSIATGLPVEVDSLVKFH